MGHSEAATMLLEQQHQQRHQQQQEEKKEEHFLESPVTLIAELEMEDDFLEESKDVGECKEETSPLQYARVGFDLNTYTFERFKQLATSLVVEKQAEMVRSSLLGSEKDINMEDSIECVPKDFLEDILAGATTCGTEVIDDSIRVMSVGELLSLFEV
jgi:hypothetical protein